MTADTTPNSHRTPRNTSRSPRSLWRNKDGVAAVEFGFIAPIMLLMLIGTIEVSRAITIDRRFGLVTSMVADLVTREENVVQDGVNILTGSDGNPNDGIYGIVRHVLGSYDNGSLQIAVIPVVADPDDAAVTKVYAGTTNRPTFPASGVSSPALCADYALAANLVSAGNSVVVVETSYTYQPILLGYVTGNMSWTDRAVLSPRQGCVRFGTESCENSACFDD